MFMYVYLIRMSKYLKQKVFELREMNTFIVGGFNTPSLVTEFEFLVGKIY